MSVIGRVAGAWSGIEERLRLGHKINVVLENPAVTGILINHQLCVGDTLGQFKRIDAGYHDVGVAVDDQCRCPQAFKVLRRLFAPRGDRFQLAQECAGRRAWVAIVFAGLQPLVVELKNR